MTNVGLGMGTNPPGQARRGKTLDKFDDVFPTGARLNDFRTEKRAMSYGLMCISGSLKLPIHTGAGTVFYMCGPARVVAA
jgi:hypothetical protein